MNFMENLTIGFDIFFIKKSKPPAGNELAKKTDLQWDLNITTQWCQKWKRNIKLQKNNTFYLKIKTKKTSKIKTAVNGSVIRQV